VHRDWYQVVIPDKLIMSLLPMQVLTECRGDLQPNPKFDAVNIVSICVQEDSCSTIDTYVLMRGSTEEYCRRFAFTFVLPSFLTSLMPIFLPVSLSDDCLDPKGLCFPLSNAKKREKKEITEVQLNDI
jgi:hypothetical protein